MKMEPEIKKNYQVKLVEEDTKPVEPERLEEDPLENLPDLSSRTGGIHTHLLPFQKLHAQKEQSSAYLLSAVVMTIGILAGLIIGVVSGF